jgi:hypothetical protein
VGKSRLVATLTALANSEMVIWSKPEDRKVTGLRHFLL